MDILGLFLGVGVLMVASLVFVVRNLVYICEPNEVLIVAGAKTRVKNLLPAPGDEAGAHRPASKVVGYRSVRGGRVVRTPLVEEVYRLNLTNMIIELSVSDAFSKGGIPLALKGVANLKIGSEEPLLSNAVERFLGVPTERIAQVAKDTLEGNLRGVLSQMTPEQVNDDKVAFAHHLLEEAEEDLSRLGLVLDTLQIQHVSDEVDYLASIGRKSNADLQRRARIAEAEAKANSRMRDAQNRQTTFERTVEAEIGVLRANAEKQLADWETRSEALQAEARAEVQALVAQSAANIEVEKARLAQIAEQLKADVLKPAEAERARLEAGAAAEVAKVIEHGKASAQALEEASDVWQRLGPDAAQVFLLQKLDMLVHTMLRPLGKLRVDRMTVLDQGQGAGGSGSLGAKAMHTREELMSTLGVDIKKVLRRLEGDG